MFATLLGGLPRPDPDLDRAVELAVRAQEDAGVEPITDGRLRDPEYELLAAAVGGASRASDAGAGVTLVVDAWRAAAGMTDRAVKQALPGPYTLGRRLRRDGTHVAAREPSPAGLPRWSARARTSTRAGRAGEREDRTIDLAEALRGIVHALVAAGCPLVEIEELDADLIGEDGDERRLFRDAHRHMVDGVVGTHLSLSIAGGSAAAAGPETILHAPYASYAFDLITGPDNWNLVTRTPADRGVVAGVLSGQEGSDEPKEVMLWAAHYAASTAGRGRARVGLGSAGSFANLTWEAAVRKMRRLGDVARLAERPPSEDLARALDPRAVSSRRAALGHDAPRSPRTPR